MRTILRVAQFVLRRWPALAGAYVCLLAATAFSMAVPWLIKEAIDVGLASGDHRFLVLVAGGVVGASALRGAFAYGQTYLVEYLSQHVAYDLRNQLYDHLQRLSFAYHDSARTGQLMSRATVDIEAVRMFISIGFVRIVSIVVLFVAVCALMLSINWRLALVSFGCLPLVSLLATVTSRRLRPLWLKTQEELANLSTILQENLSGVRVVRAFVQEAQESRKFAAKADDIYRVSMAANRIQAQNTPLMAFIMTAAAGVILWYGGREVIAGDLTLGELVAFNGYLMMLAMPMRMLGWMVNLFSRATSAGQRIFEVLDARSAVEERPGAHDLAAVTGEVGFEDVSFSYDGVAPVLRDVSFRVPPGQVVALLGAAGSGKTTVAHLVPRFYDVSAGRVSIDGTDVRDVTLESLRHHVGVVLQDNFLFSATIRDNIAYGRPDATDAEVEAAARAAHLHDFIAGLPDGYNTWVGERGITLSGGQRQRVAIARTLLVNPRILILDDALSSVDVETEQQIQEALSRLMAGRTTIVIAHRLATVQQADLVLVLQDGRIVEQGSHAELLARSGVYREIYELQLRPEAESTAVVGERR